MGSIEGHTQICVYIPDEVWRQSKLVGLKTGRPLYRVVSDALVVEVAKHVTPNEKRTLRTSKEHLNGSSRRRSKSKTSSSSHSSK